LRLASFETTTRPGVDVPQNPLGMAHIGSDAMGVSSILVNEVKDILKRLQDFSGRVLLIFVRAHGRRRVRTHESTSFDEVEVRDHSNPQTAKAAVLKRGRIRTVKVVF
jgi:hypothetical protein